MSKCEDCGEDLLALAKFCCGCGKKVEPKAPKPKQKPKPEGCCAKCGHKLRPNDKFCFECGAKCPPSDSGGGPKKTHNNGGHKKTHTGNSKLSGLGLTKRPGNTGNVRNLSRRFDFSKTLHSDGESTDSGGDSDSDGPPGKPRNARELRKFYEQNDTTAQTSAGGPPSKNKGKKQKAPLRSFTRSGKNTSKGKEKKGGRSWLPGLSSKPSTKKIPVAQTNEEHRNEEEIMEAEFDRLRDKERAKAFKKAEKEKAKKEGKESKEGEEVVGYVKYKDMVDAGSIIPFLQHGIGECLVPKRYIFGDKFGDCRKKVFLELAWDEQPFLFQDYAPRTFMAIRKLYGISQDDFIKSLVTEGLSGGKLGAGKSGMLFFFSKDKNYVVKTITKPELKFFRKIFSDYDTFIKKNHHTLLPRFFGLYKITLEGQKPFRIIVMNNLFNTKASLNQKYDLKGSLRNRYVELEVEGKRAQGVLKDLNYKDKMQLGPSREAVVEQMRRDAKWLMKMNIMDHSLLLGIHDATDGSSGPVPATAQHIDRTMLRSPLPKEIDANGRATGRMVSCFQTDHFGVRSLDADGKPRPEIYVMGIIDILQMFGTKKKLESTYKGILHDKTHISAVDPKLYGERFIAFMEARMV